MSASARVLVIEDDLLVRRAVERAATSTGLATIGAADGIIGVARLQEEFFDLVLLDIGLPRMDGRDVLQHLKQNRRTARIPVLVYSGRCTQYDRETLFRLGAEDLIEKPFGIDALVRRMARVIAKSRAGRAAALTCARDIG